MTWIIIHSILKDLKVWVSQFPQILITFRVKDTVLDIAKDTGIIWFFKIQS